MIDLLTTIKTTSASGNAGYYLNEAPQNTALPYVTYQVIGTNPYFTFDSSVEDTLVQFSVFAKTASGALTVYENLIALYDTPVAVTGRNTVFMTRQSSTGLMKDEAGWTIHADYTIQIS